MKGTFTGTGSAFGSVQDGQLTFVRGGKDKTGLLKLDHGTGTVALEVSTDNGANWIVDSSYTSDTSQKVSLPDVNAIYTLNCTAYTADIDYYLSGS